MVVLRRKKPESNRKCWKRRRQFMEIDNRALMNWLGLLIRAQKWDYGVIWKLGDDPSR